MKKLINDPGAAVREMLEGAALVAPAQAVLAGETVVIRRTAADPGGPVAVISGGGSGHEPAHAGYVGEGMLAAAIAGNVFTSPSVDDVLAGLRVVSGPQGVVMIVKNYTGDRLNFGLAAELIRAEGIPVEIVVVADDVSLRDTVERRRRRGIAGTVLVHKIAGAAAAAGRNLADVAALARRAADSVGSVGVALNGCTLPGAARGGFDLADDEIELGLGIHGEPGVKRTLMKPADELVAIMLKMILDDLPLAPQQPVALLVNGLGGTPAMELDIVLRGALIQLRARGVTVARAWRGTLLSALDMPGCSLSLMALDDELVKFLDAPTDAPAWPGPGRLNQHPTHPGRPAPPSDNPAPAEAVGGSVALRRVASAAALALLAAEPQLTELDTRAGDGDLGLSMARAARAIIELPDADWRSPSGALVAMGNALRRAVGGSSGPFYATALLRAARQLGTQEIPSAADWSVAFAAGVTAIMELGGARPGDRTMVDALVPAADSLAKSIASGATVQEAVHACAAAASQGASATASMPPRLGRSSYIGDRVLGIPDGGAVAVKIWLGAISDALDRRAI